jgi:hypothetical protein
MIRLRMRGARAAIAAAILGTVGAGCAIFAGVKSDLVPAPEDAGDGVADAAMDGAVEGAVDDGGRGDGGAGDAGVGDGAGTDANPQADAGDAGKEGGPTSAPEAIATGEGAPTDIAVDFTNLYWLDTLGGTVRMMAKAAGTPSTLATFTNPGGLGVFGTYVYTTADDTGTHAVERIAKNGSDSHAFFTNNDNHYTTVLAFDTSGVYGQETQTGIIHFDDQSLVVAVAESATAFAVGGGYAFFATASGATVWRCVLGAAPSTPIATMQSSVSSMAVDLTDVYWIDGMGHIATLPVATGSLKTPTIVTQDPGAARLAMGGNYIYWTNPPKGTVSRIAKGADAGAPETLATMQGMPLGIVVDGDTLYWTNQTGTIMRLVLPP